MAYGTGVRIPEIISLKPRDIEDRKDYIKIHIRNSKSEQRAVYLVGYRRTLLEWIKQHAFKNNLNEYLFYTLRTCKRSMLKSGVYMAMGRVKS